jgi:LysM repeat protein
MIGIRLADHSVFPVFSSDIPGGKRIVVTTARDDQERVDIELVQSDDLDTDHRHPLTIGRLTLDDLLPGHGGEPEVEVVLRLTPERNLEVSATNRATGNGQSVSIDIDRMAAEAEFSVPESLTNGFEPEFAGEIEEPPRPRRSGLLLLLFMLVVLAALAWGAWWLLLRAPADQPTDALPTTEEQPGMERAPQEPADPTEPVATTVDEVSTPDAATTGGTAPSVEESTPTDVIVNGDSVEYRIRRGDTLWDISETFYGTPWLFSELADANEISNPNLIYAESDLEIPEQLLRRPE